MPTHLCNKKEKEIIDDDNEDKGMNSGNRRMMTKKAELNALTPAHLRLQSGMMFRIPEANKHRVLTPDFLKKKDTHPFCPPEKMLAEQCFSVYINVCTAGNFVATKLL